MKRKEVLAFIASLVALTGPAALGADPFPGDLPGTQIGSNLPAGYEPSGAVWHTRLERLFLVSDDGLVTSMDADGTNLTHWSFPGDLEAICVADPLSDFVYVGVENPDAVKEFDVVTGLVARTFDLTGTMTGPDNSGLEALTFVPDPAHPEGGLFYAGLQADGKIYVFDLPIASSNTDTTVTHVTTITPVAGRSDISGLHYHAANDTLYAIFDSANALRAMHPDGTFLAEWVLPGNDQEGIAVTGCSLFIAEDVGEEVWRYESFPSDDDDADTVLTCRDNCPTTANPGQNDTDGDGVGDACDDCPNTNPGLAVDEFGCTPAADGDFNRDGDVDGMDFLTFAQCFNGSLRAPSPECTHPEADFDADNDVDGTDFMTFSACFNGSLRLPKCTP